MTARHRRTASLLAAATLLSGIPSRAVAIPTPIVLAERQVLPSVGSGLVAGDLDGSAGLELAGISGSQVNVLRAIGPRAYSGPSAFVMATSNLGDLALADLNTDGALDLVATQVTPPSVCVRLRSSGFTFSAVTAFPLPAAPGQLVLADLNGDTRPDAIVARGDSIAVLLGISGGALGAAASFPATGVIQSIACADFDGDGRRDVAACGWVDPASTLVMLHGRGDGSFDPPAIVETSGSFVLYLTAGDFDGDGDADLVAARDGSARLYRQQGSALVPFQNVTIGSSPGWGPYRVAIGDVDGDGIPDLACAARFPYADNQNHLVAWLRGAGSGAFEPVRRYHVTGYTADVVLADLDQDGRMDIASRASRSDDFASFGPPSTSVLWGGGASGPRGRFETEASFSHATTNFGDQNLVAYRPLPGVTPDLIFAYYGRLVRVRNLGAGLFAPMELLGTGVPRAALDLDTDGREELIASLGNTIWVWRCDPVTGLLVQGPAVCTNGVFIGLGDFDYDGRTDLFTRGAGNAVRVQLGGALASFGAPQPTGAILPSASSAALIADLSGDGRADLVWTESPAGGPYPNSNDAYSLLHYAIHDGAGFYSPTVTDTAICPNAQYWASSASALTSGDVDGDGDLDVVQVNGIGSVSAGPYFVYLNDATGHLFFSGFAGNAGGPPGAPTLGDLNGDGLADMLVNEPDGISFDMNLFTALGGGQYSSWTRYTASEYPDHSVFADFGGDGRLDVAVADGKNATITVMMNESAYAPPPVAVPPAPMPRAALSIHALGPNPGRGWPAFRIFVPAGGRVELEVFDISGRRIASASRIAPAAGEFRMDAIRAPIVPGLYFARARNAGQVAVTRLVIAR